MNTLGEQGKGVRGTQRAAQVPCNDRNFSASCSDVMPLVRTSLPLVPSVWQNGHLEDGELVVKGGCLSGIHWMCGSELAVLADDSLAGLVSDQLSAPTAENSCR